MDDLAGYYGLHELGVSSRQELDRRLVEIAWNDDPAMPLEVGVLVLGPLQEFPWPVAWDWLPTLGIDFSPNTVQGMGLDDGQVEALLDAGLYGSGG